MERGQLCFITGKVVANLKELLAGDQFINECACRKTAAVNNEAGLS